MESVETFLKWMIAIGVVLMIAGVIVMRLRKK